MEIKLTKREAWVLDYLKKFRHSGDIVCEGWRSPTDIGQAYGWFYLNNSHCHSSTGRPICKSLVDKGLVERNEKGHYRFKIK